MRPWSSTPTMASGADSSRSPNQRSAVAPRSAAGVAPDCRSGVRARAAGGVSEALRARGFEVRGHRPMPPPPLLTERPYYAFRSIACSQVSGTARVSHRPRRGMRACASPAGRYPSRTDGSSPRPSRGIALRPPQARRGWARRQHRGEGPPAAAPHLLEQILDLERLLDAAGGADAPSPLLRARVRGHDHDRDRRQGRIAQLLRPELLPVHHRHHEVEQDERGRRHGVQPDERVAQVEVVLDDEDGRGGAIIRLIGHDAIVDQIESFPKPDGCQNFEPLAPAREHPWGSQLGLALAWEPEACRSSRAAIWTPPSPSNPPMPTARASATGRSAPGSSSASTTATARRR